MQELESFYDSIKTDDYQLKTGSVRKRETTNAQDKKIQRTENRLRSMTGSDIKESLD